MRRAITKVRRGGFFYGWVIVAIVAAANFMEVAEFNPMVAVFMKPMIEEFGWTRAQVSFAVTLGSLGGGVLTLPAGPLVDRYGARMVLVVTQGIYGGCLVLASLITNLWQFYLAFGGGRIFAIGPTRLAGTVAISNWFVRRRGLAMGASILGMRGGQAVLPLLAQNLILAFGWRITWVILGLLVWIIAVPPSLFLMRRRPEDMSLVPDGELADEKDRTDGPITSGIAYQEVAWTLSKAIRTKALWLLTLASSLAFLVGAGVNLHMIPYLTDLGLHPNVAVGAMSLFAVVGGFGGLLWGYLSSRFPLRYCMALAFLVSAMGIIILMVARDALLAYIFAALYGLVFGGWVTLSATMVADYFGRPSAGAINGFVAPFQLFSNSLGPLLAGLVYDMTGGYLPAFSFFIGSYILAALLVFLAKPPQFPSPEPVAARSRS